MGSTYTEDMNKALYGADSVFTQAEQVAMWMGFTRSERIATSGVIYGIYPQAISQEHAAKLDKLNKAIR